MADLTTVAAAQYGEVPKRYTDQGDGTFAEKTADSVYSADSIGNAGTATAPASGAAIATIAAPPAGTYEVCVKAAYGSTADVVNGMELRKGSTKIASLLVQAAVNSAPSPSVFPRVTLDGSTALSVNASQIGAGGAVYVAEIVATRTY